MKIKKIQLKPTYTVISLILSLLILHSSCINTLKNQGQSSKEKTEIITGADQTEKYLSYIKNKRVGMVVNITSIIGNKLSVDSLRTLGVDIKAIFGPEHGFRANASNGDKVSDEVDPETGIPIISLYGKKAQPSKEDLNSIDIMVFDIADVGCRFNTKINTLTEVMEACAKNGKELLILDRPNPNAYIDGPILDMKFKSGIGKFPVPITHGMTIGEFAQMVNGEGWLANKVQCKIKVISIKNYSHDMYYTMPVMPTPNLNTQQSVLLYPSLCLFEGTIISQGRGTQMPFTIIGAPALKGKYDFSFTPVSIPGMSENPLHKNFVCYGFDLRDYDTKKLHASGKINLQWMIEIYNAYPDKERFFDSSQSTAMGRIERLIGNDIFKGQIMSGMSEEEIRKTWEPGLSQYKQMRTRYVLYP